MSSSKAPPPVPASSASSSSSNVTASSRALQETLHILLSRLSATMEHVQTWPSESTTSTSTTATASSSSSVNVHVASTSVLIQHLQQVVAALRRVEDTVRSDASLRKALQECPVPVDLLDLLDSSKLNPDVFARGLLREALGQLAGLRRRKLALEMLGSAVASGIQQRQTKRRRLMNNSSSSDSIGTTTAATESAASTTEKVEGKADEAMASTGEMSGSAG